MQLRAYQQSAVEAILLSKRGTIKAATGTGKTIIAIEWIRQLGLDTLIVVPTQALIYQSWAPKLQDAGLLDVGQYYAYSKTEGPVMITTYASAISHPELIESAEAVVLDEVHHLGARTALIRLLPRLKEKEFVLGLSAVPEREDQAHALFLKEFPICYDLNLGDAVRTGIVSPLEVIQIGAKMTNKERKSYETNTAAIKAAFKFCGPDITKWMSCYNLDTGQYVGRKGMQAIARRKKLLSRIEEKKEKILEILSRHPDERVIVFSESVQAIEEIKEYLSSNGLKSETFHSKVEPWRKMEILQEWGRGFDVLLSVRALEEGLDVKEVAVAILITSGKSKRQFIQRIGRIIRPLEGKLAKFYVVYCPGTVEETYASTIQKILRSE
ncbi:MAG TPA: DEAD/DEAH box helicase [Nitrososphaerales archaeon]|nr:DEAD/DEAH box helicase [Nitrososphaerales archaeon]